MISSEYESVSNAASMLLDRCASQGSAHSRPCVLATHIYEQRLTVDRAIEIEFYMMLPSTGGAIEITPKVSGQTNNNLVKEVFQSRPIKAALTRVTVRPMEVQSDVESKPLVWFEAQVVPTCRVVQAELCSMITRYATQTVTEITPMSIAIPRTNELARFVTQISISEEDIPSSLDGGPVMLWQCSMNVRLYRLFDEEPATEEAEDETVMCSITMLPSVSLDHMWGSLYYDISIKKRLLDYSCSAMFFAKKEVSPSLIAWNRVVLLHGPPGTGKTSLCRGLAQKLAIRLSGQFQYGQLVEVNAHSLFSKWFSESGKLVQKLFGKIEELVEERDSLVIVLIDEVESLTAARKSALSGSEPSDAIRVVNAVLTQIDKLKEHPNVLVMTTSNITDAIDLAFVDRADIKQYIGPPGPRVRYDILKTCLDELMRVGIVAPFIQLQSSLEAQRAHEQASLQSNETSSSLVSEQLYACAIAADGFSGRALRKLPFLAHTLCASNAEVGPSQYLNMLRSAIQNEHSDREMLHSL